MIERERRESEREKERDGEIEKCCGHNLPSLYFDTLGKNIMGTPLNLMFILLYPTK